MLKGLSFIRNWQKGIKLQRLKNIRFPRRISPNENRKGVGLDDFEVDEGFEIFDMEFLDLHTKQTT
ncbi:hypothetical protein GCM10027275_17540 [Rhabdobacter roseus]